MKTIKVATELLSDPQDGKLLTDIFSDDIGTQVYLQIGSTHLRSQYFNQAILNVIRRLRKMKQLPIDVNDFRNIFLKYGRGDNAAQYPFDLSSTSGLAELLFALHGVNRWAVEWTSTSPQPTSTSSTDSAAAD